MASTPPSGLTHGQLRVLRLADRPDALIEAGFDLERPLGTTAIVADPTAGVMAAGLHGIEELDGLVLVPDLSAGAPAPGGDTDLAVHPNGVSEIDHVVVTTPHPDRTREAFESAELEARRVRRFETRRGPQRQTFHWLGDTICEVIGPDDGTGDGPAVWWGLALTVDDIEATAARLAGHVTDIKPAVQPGRRVCTLRHPGVTSPVLFISTHVTPPAATT